MTGLPDRRQMANAAGVAAVLLVVAPFVVTAAPGVVGAEHGYVVLSDSMEPAISAGDVVIVEEVPPEEIDEGDVITFRAPAGGQFDEGGAERVTHRVVEVVREDGQRRFRTRGDANEEADPELVGPGDVVGEVAFAIPYVGYVVQFANSGPGLLALVVVPAVLLGVNEIWTLYRDALGTDGGATDPSEERDALSEGDP